MSVDLPLLEYTQALLWLAIQAYVVSSVVMFVVANTINAVLAEVKQQKREEERREKTVEDFPKEKHNPFL